MMNQDWHEILNDLSGYARDTATGLEKTLDERTRNNPSRLWLKLDELTGQASRQVDQSSPDLAETLGQIAGLCLYWEANLIHRAETAEEAEAETAAVR